MFSKVLITTILFLLFSAGKGEEMTTRSPAVAGAFYPSGANELESVIKKFLNNADDLKIKGDIRGLICPHAGYSFSGQTAAHAYKQIQGKKYKTIVVIGPSHQAFFNGISVQPDGHFVTPFGSLEIDSDFVKKLYGRVDFAGYYKQADLPEHSVEVQVPFLQHILGEFKIVPIIIGNQTMDITTELARALVSICDDDVLFVASSDFYHGNDYNECCRKVDAAVELIKDYDIEGFFNLATAERDIACGYGPIVTVMLTCKDLGAENITLCNVTNSGDVTGIKTPGRYVVGYASFVLYSGDGTSKETEESHIEGEKKALLNKEDRKTLLEIARRSIESAAKREGLPEVTTQSQDLQEKKGAFVTIEKKGHLRGCIGYIHPVKPLCQTVNEMARQAAIGDPRFPPLGANELSQITIEISVLSPLEKIQDVEEIEVGKHGLYILKGSFSGLLLPQVATEYGWNRETFLQQVSRKAGLPKDAWKEADLYIFEAVVFGED